MYSIKTHFLRRFEPFDISGKNHYFGLFLLGLMTKSITIKILSYMKTSRSILYLLGAIIIGFTACKSSESGSGGAVESKKAGVNTVSVHELGDPDKMNPLTSSNAGATYMYSNIFQALLGRDPVTYEHYALLAREVPKTTMIDSGPYKGGVSYEFEIRPEAVWDNGSPVTAEDYIFTIKTVKNPKVDCANIRPYFEYIKEIKVDPSNNRKFTVFLNEPYILALDFAAYYVYPEYVYDPNKIMRKFTVKQLNEDAEKLRNNADIIKFADAFNGEFHAREVGGISGSGPYKFVEWKTGQYITLEKKENWWGEKVKSKYLSNGPEKLVYTIIKDWTTAISAMKDEELDIARSIRAKDFQDLTKNDQFKGKYTLHTPDYMVYDYIAMHTRDPKFSDKKVRQALSYLVDKKMIRDVIMYGYGIEQVANVHPTQPHYNNSLKPYSLDVNKAKSMLAEAGWSDTDGDGIIDKVINGKKTQFKTELWYNQGNTRRENIAMMFKENARAAGIDVEVMMREFVVMMDDAEAHKFEMLVAGWAGSTGLPDFAQIWHSESYNGGSNFTGFGNAETDALIDKIRVNLDEPSRTKQYKEFQAILHDEAPYIFLNAHKNKLAFHKRFEKANSYVPRPGYELAEWEINPNFGAVSKYSEQ